MEINSFKRYIIGEGKYYELGIIDSISKECIYETKDEYWIKEILDIMNEAFKTGYRTKESEIIRKMYEDLEN